MGKKGVTMSLQDFQGTGGGGGGGSWADEGSNLPKAPAGADRYSDDRGGYGGDRGGYGGDRGGFGGDRGGGAFGDRNDRGGYGGDRGGYGGDRGGYGGDRGGYGGDRGGYGGDRGGGFGGDRGGGFGGGRDYSEPEFPTKPPYTAYVGNLPYELEERDLEDAFRPLKVTNVRLITDSMTGKPKGFAYVEFETADELKSALDIQTSMGGRDLRIDLATQRQEDRLAGVNWRDAPKVQQPKFQGGGFGGRGGAFGDRRGGDRGGYGDRGGDRGGYGDRGGDRGGYGGDRGGYGGDRGGDRGGFGGDRGGYGGDRGPRDYKPLNIAPRAAGAADGAATSAPAPAPAKSTRRANPFGDAKPVDTLKKELAVEEKLLAGKQQKAEPAASDTASAEDTAAAPEGAAAPSTAAQATEDPADAAANKFAGLAIDGQQ